jgi:chorismate mutase
MGMYVRGIRGATTVDHNDQQQILHATSELLEAIILANDLLPDAIASVFITVTNDLDSTFPARAIRNMAGWDMVPLMCALEIPVQGALPRCIRLMVMANTSQSQAAINHIYLHNAKSLRPDLVKH